MKSTRFLDVQGVSEYTSLSKSTIYKRVMRCTIPYLKVGKRVLFDTVQIDEWLLNEGDMVHELPRLRKI